MEQVKIISGCRDGKLVQKDSRHGTVSCAMVVNVTPPYIIFLTRGALKLKKMDVARESYI